MKYIITLLSFLFLSNTGFAQNVNIPDSNFKAALLAHGSSITGNGWGGYYASTIDTNGDGEIQTSEANAYTGAIYCRGENIANLTGLEAFTSIQLFDYADYADSLMKDSIDISNNIALKALVLSGKFKTVDLSANTALTFLSIVQSTLQEIDLSLNNTIDTIYIQENSLYEIDLSNNTALEYINCQRNNFLELDLSNNSALLNVKASFNDNLRKINIANGANTTLNAFGAHSCPKLSCIQVDDTTYANNNSNWTANIAFSLNCPQCLVNIPDSIFKAYLTGNANIDINGDGEIQCDEAYNFTGGISCPSMNISNLSGIEAFLKVPTIDCSNNQLTSLLVSGGRANYNLTELNCSNNQLTNLNLYQNRGLVELRCSNNQISWLSTNTAPDLEQLICFGNPLENLFVNNNEQLNLLSCGANLLKELNLSSNSNLTALHCQQNDSLTSLDLSNNTNLNIVRVWGSPFLSTLNIANGNNTSISTFEANNNPSLSCIEVDDPAWATTNWTVTNYNIDSTTSFSLNCNTSISNIEANTIDLIVSPNPTSSILNIQTTKQIGQVNIYSLEGRLLKSSTENTVSVSELPTGTYVIQVITDKGTGNQLFTKQ